MPFVIFGAILVAFMIVAAFGIYWGRRQRDIVRRAVESRGGSVRAFQFTGNAMLSVTFVSNHGDLRQAFVKVRRGQVRSFEEQPYERYLMSKRSRAPQPQLSGTTIDLDELMWAAELWKLPGYPAYKEAILLLADHAKPNVEIHESVSPTAGAKSNFGAVLQCIAMQARAATECESGILDLSANGQPVLVAWHVHGIRPNRTLILSVATPAPNEEVA